MGMERRVQVDYKDRIKRIHLLIEGKEKNEIRVHLVVYYLN